MIRLKPLGQCLEKLGIGRLQRPRLWRRIIEIQARKIEGVRRGNERLHHELFPNVIYDRTRKLDVGGNLLRQDLAARYACRNATCGTRGERIVGSDYSHSIDWLPRH